MYVNFKLGFHEVVWTCELRALPLAYLDRLTYLQCLTCQAQFIYSAYRALAISNPPSPV